MLRTNHDLLVAIAEYLIKVETLTKPDIDEIAATGKLAWYEAKVAEIAAKKEETAEVVEETTTTSTEE